MSQAANTLLVFGHQGGEGNMKTNIAKEQRLGESRKKKGEKAE
jgi:hypothetical protein